VQEACPFRADCYHRRALAKKSRTPPPPRRVQAPRARREPRNRRGLLLVAGAALALLAVAAIAAYFLLGRESKAESVSQAMQEAGCTFRTVEALDPGDHISDPEQTPKEWNTFPPTSGPHFGQWVIWGEYDEPIRLTEAVHNLEHGGIVMYYGEDVPQEQVTELRSFYRGDPAGMLLSPLPRLGDKIALTAWHAPHAEAGSAEPGVGEGVLAQCTAFDERAFEAFREEYRFHGPERIPPESLQPGS
jgi:hypothetical protein